MINHGAPQNKYRVLILEDDADFLSHFAKWVSEMDFLPILASNLPLARQALQRNEIDIALVDLFFRRPDDTLSSPKGLLFIKDIYDYHEKLNSGPLVIAMSGDSSTKNLEYQEISEYQRLGIVTVFLSKNNLDKSTLKTALSDTLNKKIQLDSEQNIYRNRNNGEAPHQLKVFLCHSHDDIDTVHYLYKFLKTENNFSPWMEEKDVLPGHNLNFEIDNAIRSSHVIIVCLSSVSINREGYIHKQLSTALDLAKEKTEGTIFVIPLKIDECQLPRSLEHLQSVNLFEEDGYERLLRALRYRASRIV